MLTPGIRSRSQHSGAPPTHTKLILPGLEGECFPSELRISPNGVCMGERKEEQASQPIAPSPTPQHTAGGSTPCEKELKIERGIMKLGWAMLAANYGKGVLLWSFAANAMLSQATDGFLFSVFSFFGLRSGIRRMQAIQSRAGQGANGPVAISPSEAALAKNGNILAGFWVVFAALDINTLSAACSTSQWGLAAGIGLTMATKLYMALQEYRDGKVFSGKLGRS